MQQLLLKQLLELVNSAETIAGYSRHYSRILSWTEAANALLSLDVRNSSSGLEHPVVVFALVRQFLQHIPMLNHLSSFI